MEYFIENGIQSIENLSNNNIITISNYISYIIQAEIFKLFQDNNINSFKVSKKLKTLILLSISQQNIFINNNKKEEKIILLNKDWLEQYNYKN